VFVFGYGSLAAEATQQQVAFLSGYVRSWEVAMDNLAQIPGYKYYVDPLTGERPAVHVTFLDLIPEPDAETVGLLLRADPRILAMLDARERNYDRVEVTDLVRTHPAIRTRVYAYLGTPAARARYAAAAANHTAVISRAYQDDVEQGFAQAGLSDRYAASTRPPECPVRELTRINIPLL
jgi:cation transport regulator ChaC